MQNNIKQVREQRHLSQQQCADALGIPKRTWQNYENGVREPKYSILCEIADYFDVTTDYLLNRKSTNTIDNLANECGLNSIEKILLQAYCTVDAAKRAEFLKIAEQIISEKEKIVTKQKQCYAEYTLGELEDLQAEEKKHISDAG